jgi:DNA helicase TIP49 (TBP-interacting protein)
VNLESAENGWINRDGIVLDNEQYSVLKRKFMNYDLSPVLIIGFNRGNYLAKTRVIGTVLKWGTSRKTES